MLNINTGQILVNLAIFFTISLIEFWSNKTIVMLFKPTSTTPIETSSRVDLKFFPVQTTNKGKTHKKCKNLDSNGFCMKCNRICPSTNILNINHTI